MVIGGTGELCGTMASALAGAVFLACQVFGKYLLDNGIYASIINMGHTPMKRFGKAQELSGATLLLASDAGSFITGEEIIVDGGYAAMTI